MIFERVSLDFFFFFFFLSFLMNFYDVILSTFLHSNWITLKMSERLREGGSRERGAHQVISYKSREIQELSVSGRGMSCILFIIYLFA